MNKKHQKKYVEKHVTKSMVVALLAFTMVLQLCFSSVSLASMGYGGYYDNDGYYDDYGKDQPKLKNITRTYDDGTKYTAEYGYDDKGNLISEKIKEPDGSKSTSKRTYKNDVLVLKTDYEYDASRKIETTDTSEYGDEGYPAHKLQTYKFSDGTSQSHEVWYLRGHLVQKSVDIDRDGIVEQVDCTYDDQDKMLTRISSSTDGSTGQEEWQYDGSGEVSQYQASEYDADDQVKTTNLIRLEGEGESRNRYTLETTDMGEHGVYKKEVWARAADGQPIKKITTYPDSSQSTENYTYDADGDEILYTKASHDGTTEKRETRYSKDGQEVVYTDGRGNTMHSLSSYDQISGQSTDETTENNADGSYRYTKRVIGDDYGVVSYLTEEKSADGTYTERTLRSDGSSTAKEKTSDGVVTVTEKDAEGEIISLHKTMPDGTTAETTCTKGDHGEVANEVTRYSDGSEDRTDYEYDESSEPVKWTETRRNGVSAVTVVQYTNEDKSWGNQTTTFNNGYEVIYTHEMVGNDTEQIMFTYSAGDVYQDILLGKGLEAYNVKTIYRDGRTEEVSLDLRKDEDYSLSFEQSALLMSRYNSFIEQAWTVLPSQAGAEAASEAEETVPEAAPGEAAEAAPEEAAEAAPAVAEAAPAAAAAAPAAAPEATLSNAA